MAPRIRRPLSASASRFTEGSMNDRTSAAPPVSFLGPEERARLEKPLRPLSDDWADKQVKKNRLLGHMWDGVRGRLRFRKHADEARREEERKEEIAGYQQLVEEGFFGAKPGSVATTVEVKDGGSKAESVRPTKEEIMENYQHLVASGFFSSHAIKSTRQPPPSTTASTRTSHDLSRGQRPNWPLSRNTSPSPSQSRAPSPSPVCSPPSAGSRGTKRAAMDHPSDSDGNKENDPPTPNKKLRKSASRDISLPKLRNVASRRTILTRSRAASSSAPKEPAKLAKRVLGKLPGARGSLEVPAARRCASNQGVEERKERLHESNTRVLRSRKSANEGLCVVPDTNRGIPQVPAIPAKFTYGEDRENDGPWRGLRR